MLRADVVIVGGGITGAIAAFLFSDAGIDVVLLEARRTARGSTAASTALLMQEPDKDFGELAARYGRQPAAAIWTALGNATKELAATIRRLKIDCDLQYRDSVYFTLDDKQLERLRGEFRNRRANKLPARWLSAAALRRLTGIEGKGAIVTPRNAEVDPVKACRGFLEVAAARGARIFESSPVTRIARQQDGVTVKTGAGSVRADCVLIATGYATREFKPLVARFRMMDTFVIATRRLPMKVRRKVRVNTRAPFPMVWDTDRPYHYARWTIDSRLMVGGEDVPHRSHRGSAMKIVAGRQRLLEYLARLYPALATERPEYAWQGLFAESFDGLPYIGQHRRYPRHLFALGYGGNGMTASYLAAKLLLDRYRERPSPIEALFSFRR